MPWKETINGVLTRATGYQLQRAGGPVAKPKPPTRPRIGEARAGDRLVEAPVFVICTLRSGSTLLRVLLDSHSQIRSPHELHLRYVSVQFDERWSERSMAELGLDTRAA
ncbi:MAG: sulfotransferase, partial [Solirubrobacteraceae bacterium]